MTLPRTHHFICDPRPDLVEDSALWEKLYGLAVDDVKLWSLLRLLRCAGARIVKNAQGRLKLDYASVMVETGYPESKIRQDWLIPAQSQIAAAFRAVEGRMT